MTCPCGDAGPPRPFGHAPSRWRDLGPAGGSVEVEGRRRRLRCRGCGATTSVDPVPLLAPFRMTPRLVDAILDAALETGFLPAADRFGVDEGTVREVFERRSGAILSSADAAMPGSFLARVGHAGRHRIAFAHDAGSGGLANLYVDPADPRLAAAIAGLRRRLVHVDHRMAELARKALHSSCTLVVHRASAEDALERRLAPCVRNLHRSLGPEGRRALQPVRPVLAKRPASVSWAEAAAMREAASACDALREFAERRDALMSVFGSPRRAEAAAAVAGWRRSLSTPMRAAFLPALGWLDQWGPSVLNAGYGRVPLQAWRRACAYEPPVLARDSAMRIVVRGIRLMDAVPAPAPARVPGRAARLSPAGPLRGP